MMFSKCEPLQPLNKQITELNNKTTLSCYLSNVRFKLNRKKAEYISYWCQTNEIDMIFLTETGFDPDRPAYFDIKGYEIISVANKKHMNLIIDRISNECGGSMILWNKNSRTGLKKPKEIVIENTNSWFQICGARLESNPGEATLIAL